MKIQYIKTKDLKPDPKNPRKSDDARMMLLRLSLSKLGFILPIYANKKNMILSGHQRLIVSSQLGFDKVPVDIVDIPDEKQRGINVLFNRATNDFSAFDTGAGAMDKIDLSSLVQQAEKLKDFSNKKKWYIDTVKIQSIKGLGEKVSEQYDKKAIIIANNLMRLGIQIPLVITDKGDIINGVHRLFAAREAGVEKWPVVTVPHGVGQFALNFLNYLSMDYDVDDDFGDLLRYSAYRRPQNNRGAVPKAYRFWANGERTLPDKDSYTKNYWVKFRDIHGKSILDFGSGLSKVAPFLCTKGVDCIDFEPYRILPEVRKGEPDIAYSKEKAKEFLEQVSDGRCFDSIFMASVINSIPFPYDRACVLAIVHSLCSFDTVVYGTCRDISDFEYEYSGIRNANYFVFDSEPGVRLGDSLSRPKIQKFYSPQEVDIIFKNFWNIIDYWPGGNIFYWRLKAPKRVNKVVLSQALDTEFERLPYADGTRMGLGKLAKQVFGKRLGMKL